MVLVMGVNMMVMRAAEEIWCVAQTTASSLEHTSIQRMTAARILMVAEAGQSGNPGARAQNHVEQEEKREINIARVEAALTQPSLKRGGAIFSLVQSENSVLFFLTIYIKYTD